MSFQQEAELKGFDRVFKVSPACKAYTLRDNGFMKTNSGNHVYKRDMNVDHKQGLILKVMVNKDLDGLSIATVSHNELKRIDVSKLDNNAMLVEKINFIFDGFIDRNVLVEVK
ncbi:cysteine desulfurase [Ignavigranum ruoffiae]|uniref:Putative amino acid metabolism n=1 Tax=Ignavigranum ruoffiae TaxID=89093 RepID=A0A1H8YVG7_9LACT|nr:cysteine desulfurase [Ignavigranum ruoffiae]UPQ85367.1 DUF1831 domain-containing protein [Ignavigranum ruoffiae]SEP56109.1 Putative amino acid metabolism [Ignavigranum ruoffiae]